MSDLKEMTIEALKRKIAKENADLIYSIEIAGNRLDEGKLQLRRNAIKALHRELVILESGN